MSIYLRIKIKLSSIFRGRGSMNYWTCLQYFHSPNNSYFHQLGKNHYSRYFIEITLKAYHGCSQQTEKGQEDNFCWCLKTLVVCLCSVHVVQHQHRYKYKLMPRKHHRSDGSMSERTEATGPKKENLSVCMNQTVKQVTKTTP
jgi:hypothetical protein